MTVSAQQIGDWLRDLALPLWSGAGWDDVNGGFFDDLSLSGAAVTGAPKRLRVQARQIYVFSHAHLLGWTPPAGGVAPLDAAARGFDFMVGHYWQPGSGGFVYSVAPDGAVADPRIDFYEQAFALFACAWYLRAAGDERAATWAERVIAFLDSHLADPIAGGYFDTPSRAPPRRQNPHMHYLEALLALHQARGDAAVMARARAIVALVRERFLDRATGTLGEVFEANWRPAPGTAGQIVEPGHHYEWIWLLHQYAAASGDDCQREAGTLYRFAEHYGIDRQPGPTEGLVFDAVLRAGTTHDAHKRLWGQTEAIKAHAARLELAGEAAARAHLDTMLSRLFACHLVPDHGLWREHLQRDGTPLRDTVPATSLYHIFLALTEVLRVRDGVTAL